MRESCKISEGKYQLKVETMESMVELLLETLGELSPTELRTFRNLFLRRGSLKLGWLTLEKLELKKVVFPVVQTYGRQSVELAGKILKYMNRMDLVEQMEGGSSRAKKKRFDELLSAEIHRVSAVAVRKDLVLEILTDLKAHEFWKFKWFLQLMQFQKSFPQIPWSVMQFSNRADLVNMMWTMCADRCLQVTEEVLMDLHKSDLVEKLPVGSSSFKEKLPVVDLWPELKQKVKDMESVIKMLLEELHDLTFWDLEDIRNILSWYPCNSPSLSIYLKLLGMKADLQDTMLLLVQTYSEHPVDKIEELLHKMGRDDLVFALTESKEKKHFVGKRSSTLIQKELGLKSVQETRRIFMDMNRTGLLKMLPGTTPGIKEEPLTSLDPVDYGSAERDSSSWTKVDPEVDRASPDEAPTYSLQSEAGQFECCVSGLRWVCKEKVGFRYRFCSWEGHMERMESRGYRPAGPLLDITVFTGKMMEVQLPHWVCIGDVPELLDNFAVLHVNDCGDVLEKVTQVTATHVGLTEPVFSLLAAVINYLFPPRITCNTLIYYQPNTPFLKLHVYLIPPDPALKQLIHREESSSGYDVIKKPRPDKPLKMDHGFSLKVTVETATIQPPEITLRHDSQDPNFYEVFIENPDGKFNLELLQTPSEKVWFCEIRKDDHPKSGPTKVGGSSAEAVAVKTEEEHFVDKHRDALIQRARNIGPILDGLLQKKVLQQETYDTIRSLPTSEARMREIFSCLTAADVCKDIFLSILQEKEQYLIADLQRQE
ncbi:uncharacterized protein FYW61_006147 isoform 2-T2 [Anableps anableps]